MDQRRRRRFCAPRGTRQAWFGQWREVPVYALDNIRPGHVLAGPAIEAETTTVAVEYSPATG